MTLTKKILVPLFELSDEAIQRQDGDREEKFSKRDWYIQKTGISGINPSQVNMVKQISLQPVGPENRLQTGIKTGCSQPPNPGEDRVPIVVDPRPAAPWPTPKPGEPTIAGLPIRRCPVCGRQLFWISPDRPPHCVACGLEEAQAGKEGGAMTQ